MQLELYCIHLVYVTYFYRTHGDAEVFWVTVSELATLYAWGMSLLEAALMRRIHPWWKAPILRILIPVNNSPVHNNMFAEASNNEKS